MKTGIYGGTFNPIHKGHLHILEEFSKRLSLDRVLLIPARVPPHKQAHFLASGEARMELCRLAAQSVPGLAVEVCDIELRRSGKSYTADTLEELSARYPEEPFYLLMGEDMFLTLGSWYRPETIFALSVPCASPRSPRGLENLLKKQQEYETDFSAKTIVENIPWLNISSTEIRERASRGKDISTLVPPQVAEYLEREKIYTGI